MADETTPPETTPEPELSLAEHEAQFAREGATRHTSVEPATESQTEAPSETTVDGSEPTRDEKGRFQPRTPRDRRPASHRASPEDVPRIAELTKKLRETEAERDQLKTRASATTPPAQSTQPAAPVSSPVAASSPPTARAKPTPADKDEKGQPKYATYEDYLDDRDAWNREQWSASEAQQRAERDAATHLQSSWRTRTESAKSKYDDFEQVALLSPTAIPQGSLIDRWILEHDAGAEILYHLQKHPTEVTQLLALPLLKQVDSLSLLGQRLTASPTRTQAALTGAAARPTVVVPPRPPTPVRTGPVRAADEPPDDDASIAEHEKYYGQRSRRG